MRAGYAGERQGFIRIQANTPSFIAKVEVASSSLVSRSSLIPYC